MAILIFVIFNLLNKMLKKVSLVSHGNGCPGETQNMYYDLYTLKKPTTIPVSPKYLL